MYTYLFHIHTYIYIYIYICIYIYINMIEKKSSHKTSDAERTRAWLLYLTQTGEHRVFSIRRGQPVQRFLPKRGRKTPFLASISKPHHGFCFGLWKDRKIRTTGLSKPLGYYPNRRTRCNIPVRRSNNPQRSQHWCQAQHKTHQRHHQEQ